MWDWIVHDDIEGRDAVSGDHHEDSVRHVVGVAHLAAMDETGHIGGQYRCRHVQFDAETVEYLVDLFDEVVVVEEVGECYLVEVLIDDQVFADNRLEVSFLVESLHRGILDGVISLATFYTGFNQCEHDTRRENESMRHLHVASHTIRFHRHVGDDADHEIQDVVEG